MTAEPRPPLLQSARELAAGVLYAVRAERTRTIRLLALLERDAAQAATAPQLLLQGEVLKTQLAQIPKGAKQFVVAVPWEPERVLAVALDPARSAHDNVQRLFKRAKGLQRAQHIVLERQVAALDRLAAVQAALLAWQHLENRAQAFDAAAKTAQALPERARDVLAAAKAWCGDAAQLGLRPKQARPERTPVKSRSALPHHVDAFTSPLGQVVYAGRSAQGNDALVTRLLRGRDWWFHVRDQSGAHVVLQAKVGELPPIAEWQACAALCGHLSGVPKGEYVEVMVCAGKNVRKVKGAPAGSVYARDEKALRVQVAAQVVDGFYARRQQAALVG